MSHPAWLVGARTAPSAHNTQPWRFTPLPDGTIAVSWEAARALPISDPTRRDLYLGLGAAIEAACLQAGASDEPIRFIPAPEWDGGQSSIGHLDPDQGPCRAADLELARWLPERQTARLPYQAGYLPAGAAERLEEEAERCGHSLLLVQAQEGRKRLSSLAVAATKEQFADSAIHAELWQWLRLDPKDPAYRRDGLTADCLGLTALVRPIARALLHPKRMEWLARHGVHGLLATDTGKVVLHAGALCLLTAPEDSPVAVIQAGRTLLRLWLLAASEGLQTHPVSALLDSQTIRGEACAVFGLPAGQRPLALFRLGRSPAVVPRAPRLPADELLRSDP